MFHRRHMCMMKQYIILVPVPASLDVLTWGIWFWLLLQCTVYEPKCGGMGVGLRLRGLSQWVQLCTNNKLWRSKSKFNLCIKALHYIWRTFTFPFIVVDKRLVPQQGARPWIEPRTSTTPLSAWATPHLRLSYVTPHNLGPGKVHIFSGMTY